MSIVENISIPVHVQQLITAEQAWHYFILPKVASDSEITFFTDVEKLDHFPVDELEMLLGRQIKLEGVEYSELRKVIGRYYRKAALKSDKVQVDVRAADDFLSKIIREAKTLGSSDIHIEIYDDIARVRIRIDGMLVERYQLDKSDYPALINKVKINANLDIAEKRLPQDGRIRFYLAKEKVDIRVSILPTLHGEKVVMRLLSNDATNIDIELLGLKKDQLHYYQEGTKKPNGIILISGPTGSGKTTTLYATLKILNEEKRNIVTVEDPIEYTLDGINQVQLKESIGLTFASALRTFLRQDPDIIMLGEIRDIETAEMAIRAALTGHLVLSTIHTNSAWGTISRLIDMGVQPFLLSETINTSVAQRLVRTLCKTCKKEEDFDPSLFPASFRTNTTIEKHSVAVGCEDCYYTGYKGRKAVYEVIPINRTLATRIKSNVQDISTEMKEMELSSLSDNALHLFKNGETSIEEIYPILLNDSLK